MSDPIPADEWSSRIPAESGTPVHEFPPRPDVVQVAESDLAERALGSAEHEGHRPADAPVHPTPDLLRPEQQRRPLWRRPPGQKDDKGEPTSQLE